MIEPAAEPAALRPRPRWYRRAQPPAASGPRCAPRTGPVIEPAAGRYVNAGAPPEPGGGISVPPCPRKSLDGPLCAADSGRCAEPAAVRVRSRAWCAENRPVIDQQPNRPRFASAALVSTCSTPGRFRAALCAENRPGDRTSSRPLRQRWCAPGTGGGISVPPCPRKSLDGPLCAADSGRCAEPAAVRVRSRAWCAENRPVIDQQPNRPRFASAALVSTCSTPGRFRAALCAENRPGDRTSSRPLRQRWCAPGTGGVSRYHLAPENRLTGRYAPQIPAGAPNRQPFASVRALGAPRTAR